MIRRGALALAPALLVLAAAALGSLSLFAIALGLISLYVGSLVSLAVAARRLEVVRTIDRHEVQEGQPVTLRFALRGLRGLPVSLEALGPRGHWLVLDESDPRVTCVVDRPGAHVIGASPLRLRDDLGLFSRALRGGAPESLLVLPVPLRPERLAPGGAEVAGDPEPDGLRPYTPGTPMSRVHWASAARGGDLQERHFATGQDQLPLVVVDTSGADLEAVDWVARSAAGIVLALSPFGRVPGPSPWRPRPDRARRPGRLSRYAPPPRFARVRQRRDAAAGARGHPRPRRQCPRARRRPHRAPAGSGRARRLGLSGPRRRRRTSRGVMRRPATPRHADAGQLAA